MDPVIIDELILVLISKKELILALQLLEKLKPKNEKMIVENLIAALIAEHNRNSEKTILELKARIGEELTQTEANEILRPYLEEDNASHRPCYSSVSLGVVSAASKETVMSFLDLAFGDPAACGEGIKRELYRILKTKI